MEESEKPFACPSPGCNMSFVNEDHLVVHKKKHDMILNFGSTKAGIFVADQTPTPTRFIRNCEEMGLFQDLQNVNPFEETFRRAVESGKLGSPPEPEIAANDDTLHTPHIFPHIQNEPSASKVSLEAPGSPTAITRTVTNTTIKKTTEIVVIQEADTSVTPVIPATSSISITDDVQFLLKMDDGKLMPMSAIPVCGSNSVPGITTQPLEPQTIVIKTNGPVKSPQIAESKEERLSLAKKKLKQVLENTDSSNESPRPDKNENSEKSSTPTKKPIESPAEKSQINHKKLDILARNRASSMRSRAKRKQWIQQLEKSVNSVNEVNTVLEAEIKLLRAEVARLKTLLLAHENCPVTKAMEKGENLLVEAQMIPVARNLVVPAKHQLPTDSRKSTKRKPPVLPQMQSLLLPKPDDKNGPICVTNIIRSPQSLNVIDRSNSQQKSPCKLLILQNSPSRKVQSLTSSHILKLFPS